MTGTKKKTQKENKVAKVHHDLEGFDVKIDKFGELTSNINVDALNAFLDKNVNDKKLHNLE